MSKSSAAQRISIMLSGQTRSYLVVVKFLVVGGALLITVSGAIVNHWRLQLGGGCAPEE
jgi:hypothetical protein